MSAAAEVVSTLAAARRGVQLYPPAHPAYAEALDALLAAVADAASGGQLVLNLHQGHLYHESIVLADDVHGAASIAEAFESRSIESLTFLPSFGHEDALGLIDVLTMKPGIDFDIEAELASRSVVNVVASVLLSDEDEETEERDKQKKADQALYQRSVAALRQLQERFRTQGAGDLSDAGQMVGSIMDRMLANPSAVMGLATIRGASEGTLFHALNVMIYSLALGQKLGIPDEGLASLGMSALLHDIGKAAFEADNPDQAEPMRLMHPKVGADILQRAAVEDPSPMLVAYEHHMHADGTGWPEREADYISHPYSRMVAVANRYENLIAPQDGQPPLTPDKAIVQVLNESASTLDPFFAKLFANALGVFPVGCLVRMSDHAVGIVVRAGDDPLAPVVKMLYDDRGTEHAEHIEVDLGESDVRIVEVIDPEMLQITVAEKI